MWKPVVRGEFPFWALELNSVWRHRSGYWLTSTTKDHSTLWEIRTPDGVVFINQLDLPFREGLEGAPVAWADKELSFRRVA
jgi:hypothetical protein